MSVTMAKADGVTVFTLTSDPQSSCPPLCQILAGLCYSPVCCSVSQHLKRVQKSSQSVLGALHIMVGLLNIGLGAILCNWGIASSWEMESSQYPFWLGALFMFFGVVSILSEKFPSPCLVILSVILNLAGVGFAIAAIVLYSMNIAQMGLWWTCGTYDYYYSRGHTPSPYEDIVKEKCLEGKELSLMILRSINAVLIVLSVLELCVTISSAVLGIKALRSREKKENKFAGTGRMSVTMAKADGVTVLTLTSDPQSSCPPLCQILAGLCYCNECCSMSQHLKKSSQSVLWVILSVILNLAGVVYTTAGIVLNNLDLEEIEIIIDCGSDDYYYSQYNTPSPHEDIIKEKCLEGKELIQMIVTSICALLVVLTSLEICVQISSAVLGIKALCGKADRMSVTMAKADGVTVFTLTSDPQSSCPPLCQILAGLCYSPVCCSVSQHLKRVQKSSQSVLGFMFFGVVSILSEKFPSPCLVILSVILNLAGVGFAIAAIVLYIMNIAQMGFWWMCDSDDYYYSRHTTPSPHEDIMKEKCLEGKELVLMILRSINAVLIVLSVLELCVTISSAVLGIKALRSREKKENKALHIMVGLLNIGLGAILTSGDGVWWMRYIGFPFWLGALFMFFGVVSILSEKFPSPCLVILSVILNLAGVGFAIAAIVLYSISIALMWFWWMCESDDYYYSQHTTPSPHEDITKEKCLEGKELVLMLQRSIDAVLIVLSVLELCVTISSAVLGIKALRSREKKENKALHIMVGLLNIGLGATLTSGDGVWWIRSMGFPFWLGAVFMFFGVVSILSEKFPSPCLVILSVILNLAGFAFAITAIILYSISIGSIDFWWMCRSDDYYYPRYTTQSPHEDIMKEKCLEGKELILMLRRSVNAVLIVLSALEICVTISSAVLGIKALCSREKKENKSTDDPEHCKQLREDVTNNLMTIQIMIGLFNIGLGPGRTSTYPGDFTSLGAAYWLGGVFILTGIMSILAGQCPSCCLVGFTVFMNIAGAIFAITGIVLYAIDLGNASLLWMCERSSNNADYFANSCRTVALLAQNLLTSMDALLIVLAVLHLYVSIRLAILCIGALSSKMKNEELGFGVFVNMTASIVAILGIVLYAMDLQSSSYVYLCDNKSSSDNCIYVAYYLERLTTGMDITMIVLTGLQVLVNVTLTVLDIEALCGRMRDEAERDAEIHKPLLKEVLMTSPGA
ncbi:hypothetical protein GBF38_013890 [Nibea albiflora]|uniref:Uncharacterized protein n=1 Tax=Nibea albiflora TaxID=240163 RepID=A0ACB7F742_NIBAL|nr:hypothetical protein GBF38_013890 [Nibea albiflora]